jgi:hypothetical protein
MQAQVEPEFPEAAKFEGDEVIVPGVQGQAHDVVVEMEHGFQVVGPQG